MRTNEFDGAEELPSNILHPPLRATVASIEAFFRSENATLRRPLRNPHHETKVGPEAARRGIPSAVLIPIVDRGDEPTLVLTRRHADISFAGHVCFPGGRADAADAGIEATALREAQEEIALPPERVRVLGTLGDYVTQSGFRITPVVGIVEPPLQLVPRQGEVEQILEIPLAVTLRSESYRLIRRPPDRGLYVLEHGGNVVTGPTVSLMIGLYEALLAAD